MLLLKEEGAVSLSILCSCGRKELYRWPVYAVAEGRGSSVHFMLLQKEEGSLPLLRKEEGAVSLSILCCCGRKKELYRWPVYAVAEMEEIVLSISCCCRRKKKLGRCPFYLATKGGGLSVIFSFNFTATWRGRSLAATAVLSQKTEGAIIICGEVIPAAGQGAAKL